MTRASLPGLHFLPALAGSSMHRWLHRKRPCIDWVTVLPLGRLLARSRHFLHHELKLRNGSGTLGGHMSKTTKVIVRQLLLLLSVLLVLSNESMADRSREQTQAQLDRACEMAREAKLAPMREKFIGECVKNKEQPDRRSCEAFYADFGAQSGNRAPLFYDLPECVEAFDFQNSQRKR